MKIWGEEKEGERKKSNCSLICFRGCRRGGEGKQKKLVCNWGDDSEAKTAAYVRSFSIGEKKGRVICEG